jgi:uncharacterized protein YjiS (DUF1127 family)
MAYALSGERPHRAAWPLRPFIALARHLAGARAAAHRRKALTRLIEMDDYRLWDLGIARADLARALRAEAFDLDHVRDWRRSLDVWPPR